MKEIRKVLDLSDELEEFLNEYVRLPEKEQKKLKKLRRINIDRLKDGLKEYNEENKTNYRVINNIIQGSAQMFTVIQNEEKNYDIDVAIVFDEENIGDIPAITIRRIVRDALANNTRQFNAQPEVKTSCVRLHYAEGYHIDFAIFKRSKNVFNDYVYKHAGASWTTRDIKGVENWFDNENKKTSGLLRKIVRLSKQMCSSKANMPSGLIQTALCAECLSYNDRLDIAFYETIKNIKNRLTYNTNVFIPVDGNRSLTERKVDIERVENYRNLLSKIIFKLEKLEDYNCTRIDAISAWNLVFEHDYWKNSLNENFQHDLELALRDSYLPVKYNHTEEFIEDKYIINDVEEVELKTTVTNISGFRDMSLECYLSINAPRLRHGVKIKCELKNDKYYDYDYLLWKVRNVGKLAKEKNMIRGQIMKRGACIEEPCSFYGDHYIECYLIKNNKCIGIGHVDIPIGDR